MGHYEVVINNPHGKTQVKRFSNLETLREEIKQCLKIYPLAKVSFRRVTNGKIMWEKEAVD